MGGVIVRMAIVLLTVLALAPIASSNPSPAWPGVIIDFDEDGVPDSDIHTSIYPDSSRNVHWGAIKAMYR